MLLTESDVINEYNTLCKCLKITWEDVSSNGKGYLLKRLLNNRKWSKLDNEEKLYNLKIYNRLDYIETYPYGELPLELFGMILFMIFLINIS